MATVGRLKEGDLLLTGEVNERLPVVTSDLLTHFPMDGTTDGVSRKNKLDTTQWKVGTTGTQGSFSQNGDGNTIVLFQNPWGYEEPTWASINNDAASDADGGWNVNNIPIDPTKKYRLSVWIRREDAGNGTTYFGCQGSTVCNLGTTTVNTNPYFGAGNYTEIREQWVLFVGYIHPQDYAGTNDPTNGMYYPDGTRIRGFTDYKWEAGETVGGHRTYLYYSTTPTERQYWVRPRMEVCDGTEASIQDLLNDREDITYATSSSNLVIRDEYIGMEEATTNTWNGPFYIYNNHGETATLTQLSETYLGEPVYRLGFKVTNAANLSHYQTTIDSHGVYGGTQSWVQDTYYVSSIYWRPVNKADTQFGGIASNTAGWNIGENIKQADGWTRYYRWRTGAGVATKSDAVHHSFICPSLQLNEWIYIDICCPQTETGRLFPTSYVNSSKSTSAMEIPVRTGSDFTIAYKFTPNIDWAKTPNFSGGREIWDLYDKNTGKKVWLYDYKGTTAQTNTAPWIGFDQFVTNAYSPWHWHAPGLNWRANKEYYFVLTKNGATWTKYWLDESGHQVQSATHTDAALIAFIPDRLVFLPQYSQRMRNLSIYNRALALDEVMKWYGGAYEVSAQGNLITNSIVEKPNGIPADSIHIPLDFNSKDRLNYLSSSEDINTLYSEEGVWVGSSYTNQFTHSPAGTFAVQTGNAFEVMRYADDEVTYRHQFAGELWNYKGQDFSVASGTTYSASIEIFVSSNFNGNYTQMANIEQTGARSFAYDMSKKGTWQRFTHTFTPTAAGTTRFLMYPGPNNASGTEGYVLYRNVQFVALPYMPPFVNGTRNVGALEFNLNRDHQLSWAGDWSIVYWKKPIGTYTSNLIGYNLESLGSNSNSVGGGYIFWGKTNNADTIYSSSPGTIVPSKYFGTWRMVSVTKSGATITIKEWEPDGTVHVRTGPTTTTVANYYVNQYGYDFKMGGWDNSSPGNSYYRDLVIAKRAFTDVELETMYKTQMRATPSGLQLQKEVKENQIL